MSGHGVNPPPVVQLSVYQRADDGEENRRAVGPPVRVALPQYLATFAVAQRKQLGAVELHGRAQATAGELYLGQSPATSRR